MAAGPRTGAAIAPVMLELAPHLAGGEAYGRHDAILLGRAVAGAPIESIALFQDGLELARAEFPPEPDAVLGTLHARGFRFVLARPVAAAALEWDFTLGAATADGATVEEPCSARRQPDGDGGWLERGPAWALPQVGPAPPLVLHVERAAIDPAGQLIANGWCLAERRVLAVQAFLDGERVGAARLGIRREDVAAAYGGYPDAGTAGFALVARISPAEIDRIVVSAIAEDGTSVQLSIPLERTARLDLQPPDPAPGRTTTLPDPASERRRIDSFCDAAEVDPEGTVLVSGWAVAALGISAITILHRGQVVGEAEAGQPRPDVAETFVSIPMARHAGFTFTGRLPAPPIGEESIEVRIENGIGASVSHQLALARRERLSATAPVSAARPAPAASETFRLELDRPALADGIMIEPVTSRLTLEGWVLARAGIAALTVYLDGQRLGEAHTGLVRADVERAMPDWPDALRSGFAFHFPPRLLRDGSHRAELVLRAADGTSVTRGFAFAVTRPEGEAEAVTVRARIDPAEQAALARALDLLAGRAAFRFLILGAEAAAPEALEATLASLRAQILCPFRAELLAQDAAAARRLRRRLGEAGEGEAIGVIVAGTPWPPAAGDGSELCGPLLAGDRLDGAALAEFALAAALDPATEFLYADESRVSPVSGEREPFFKPDFSPDLLRASPYIGRPWVARAALLRRVGGFAPGPAGEYDLVLRATEQAVAVGHVPRLLARRGEEAPSDPAAARAVLEDAAARAGLSARVEPGLAPGSWRFHPAPPPGRVSIVIPTNGAGGHIETCLASLRAHTGGREIEIVCIENIPDSRAALRDRLRRAADQVIAAPAAFNWSRFNNLAAAVSGGEFLLFLNDDIEIEQPDWLEAMLEALADPAVGVVGARLLYPDRTVQHAGMFLAGEATGRHAFRFAAAADPAYFGLALTTRNVSAVTGACMLMRRSHFQALGGFDETHEVINNDLDFCLRTLEAGKRVVYTPHACLIHHELASRGSLSEDYDLAGFAARWRTRFAAGDPFHNQNLSTDHDDARPNDEPVRVLPGGGARLDRASIRRILAVKVDHIGDFVTALPAIRRLKATFPAAAIHVLASPAAAALAALEPAIAEIIPFAFFHARSALGRVALDPEELAALSARLAPYRFDLAMDLRKHLDTRELLHCAGARWYAGFDHMGQFPWLDIALEWEGDRALHPKRQHVTEDLQRLVDAVGLAATPRPAALPPPPAAPLPEAIGALFARPVVAVHLGAGNEMKQWPIGHFVALLALILARHPVNLVLIGGADEAPMTAEVEAALAQPGRVGSVAGSLGLGALPALLARCALFLGNDSGPKHIAASLGVPTIGIHSGTVDPTEWGPLGEGSTGIARAMTCGPCYLNDVADCPRQLACIRGIDPAVVYRQCRPVLAALAPPLLPPRERGLRAVPLPGRRRSRGCC